MVGIWSEFGQGRNFSIVLKIIRMQCSRVGSLSELSGNTINLSGRPRLNVKFIRNHKHVKLLFNFLMSNSHCLRSCAGAVFYFADFA